MYWFGNWPPRGSIFLGVSFVIDPIGAGMAVVCAALVTAAFVFTWRCFDAVGVLFHSLLLVFLAAICGFCLSGDLFNMFVYFELMSVAPYALTGYKAEEPGPLQGALNFAITNSVGASMVLSGIALLYARTGALNLAAIGRALSAGDADGLVVVAFVFVVFGFLVKGAVVPFHFWLADAHAVAPTPVCLLFSGVMVELGLYAAARVYWTVFAPTFRTTRAPCVRCWSASAVATALVGAVMALVQSHLKRLLAFSTVTYAGLFLIGFAMFDARALAGTALWVVIVFVVASGLSAAAGLRAAGRVFLGLESEAHPPAQPSTAEHYETVEARSRTPLVMLLPIVALVVAGLGLPCPRSRRGSGARGGALLRQPRLCRGGHRRHPGAPGLPRPGGGRRLGRSRSRRCGNDGPGRRPRTRADRPATTPRRSSRASATSPTPSSSAARAALRSHR